MRRSPARQAKALPAAGRETRFVRTGPRTFAGHVFDPNHPARTFAVELLIDGRRIAVAEADRYATDLAGRGCGDACYGFGFRLDQPPEAASRIEVRLANLDVAVGEPLMGDAVPDADRRALPELRWLGGLRFAGWLPADAEVDRRVSLLVDGELVGETRPSGWGRNSDNVPGRTFDLHLPERFADSRLHRLSLRGDEGERLSVAPLPFVAAATGIVGNVAGPERLRAELLDSLLPMSFPMARYAEWRERFREPAPKASATSVGVILVGTGDPEATLESLEAQSHVAWVAAVLPSGEGPCDFDQAELRAFLAGDGAGCAVYLVALAGTRLLPEALARIAAAFDSDGEASLVYPDVAVEAADGALWPLFFPAFDYERLLEQGYCCHLFAMRRDPLERALGRKASNLYRLFNAVLDGLSPDGVRIVHLPGEAGILPDFDRATAGETLAKASASHLRRGTRCDAADGGILPAVRIRRPNRSASVAIVVTCQRRGDDLARSVDWIRAASPEAEVIVVAGEESGTDGLPAGTAVIRGTGLAAQRAHLGIEGCTGEYVCLLEAGIEPVDGWLAELLSRAMAADVGAVAPLVVCPNGLVAEAGVIAGPNFSLAPAHADRVMDDPGYGDLLQVAHQQSLPGSACVLVRRADYHAVGGMDAIRFPEHSAVADLCLKLAAAGLRNIFAPRARLIDHRPGRRHPLQTERHNPRYERELANLRAKWGALLAADPFYSPMLALDGMPFSALAWPPRPADPRLPRVPAPADIPPGF